MRVPPARTLLCYHCCASFSVAARAVSITCPRCYKRLNAEDVEIVGLQRLRSLETCGRVVVRKKASLTVAILQACEGVEVMGDLDGRIVSGGPVVLSSRVRVRGDVAAPALAADEGCQIVDGFYQINAEAVQDVAGEIEHRLRAADAQAARSARQIRVWRERFLCGDAFPPPPSRPNPSSADQDPIQSGVHHNELDQPAAASTLGHAHADDPAHHQAHNQLWLLSPAQSDWDPHQRPSASPVGGGLAVAHGGAA